MLVLLAYMAHTAPLLQGPERSMGGTILPARRERLGIATSVLHCSQPNVNLEENL